MFAIMSNSDQKTPSEDISTILPGLLRPLVRLLIARGVSFPILQRLLKQVYVTSADEDFRIDGESPTDSRVSLLTGVHRRDVKDLRGAGGEYAAQRRGKTLLATVVGRWLADPQYRGEDGAPIALHRQTRQGVSFESLVRSINRDVRPRTVLDELLRQGIVEESGPDLFALLPGAVVGPADSEAKLVFFAENVGDHLTAAARNLESDPSPFFERAVFYNRLSPESIQMLESRARELARAMLTELNSLAADRQKEDLSGDTSTQRFRLGVFMLHGRETAEALDDEGKD